MTGPAAGANVPIVLVLAALACGSSSGSTLGAPPVAQTPQSAPYRLPAPAGEPIAGGYGVAARGQGDYATYCAPCHGSRGGGDGPLARMLVPAPPRHSDAEFMNALSDEYLFRLLKEGGPALGKSALMGVWGRNLSEQQIRDLVAFLRSLAVPGDRQEFPLEKKGTAQSRRIRAQSAEKRRSRLLRACA
jgi:cytochrome c oxidase cbb3-type subunit III